MSTMKGKKKPQKKQGKKKGQGRFKDDSKPKFVNKTPPGQLKDFSQEMEAGYDPEKVESAWNSWWEAKGLFQPDMDAPGEPFVIVIPPPNVTGTLHLGHALTVSIEDAVTRWNRMCGKKMLWVPGTDHAGIATQVVVEKKLMRERKLSRHDLGREKFLEEVWKWKEENGSHICQQLRRLGASVDWSRLVFTMDEKLSIAVTEAFVRFHKKGLLYRANRMVNWSCALQTAISAIEVEHEEIKEPKKMRVPGYDEGVEVGWLTAFAYKFLEGEGEVVVATTRLETMLGDVAVAVHPDDPRYKDVIGKKLKHPFIEDREMVVVADDVLVDMNFGTGAVKITPGHDPNDFECGKRHKLKTINIFDESGCVNENGGSFKGMKRYHVRKILEEKMKEMGILRGKTKNPMQIGVCSRSGDLIEPVVRPQWWVSCKGMADAGVAAVKKGELEIMPPAFKHTWYQWLENIQDWCVSRQLWWGHRIPAYYVHFKGEERTVAKDCDMDRWIVARNKEDAMKQAKKKFKGKKFDLQQDEDVLDTWFSSGLFPFSVMGWPEETEDLKNFYPNALLETGHDILFFWVARMVMQGLELTGKLPFTKVYLHPMVRDKAGRKMSKSLGNVVDPINVMDGITLEALHEKLKKGNLDPREVKKAIKGQKESFPHGIAECGSDALRFGLLAYCSQGRNINLDIQRVVAYRQFGNKLWNATKFALMHLGPDFKPPLSIKEVDDLVEKTDQLCNRWILSRLSYAIKLINDSFEAYEFGEGTTAIYNFWLSDLCDVYLEMIKPAMREDTTIEENALKKKVIQNVLYTCLHHGLRLMHPFMPFITEELFHRLPGHNATTQRIKKESPESKLATGSIMIQPYPIPSQNNWRNEAVEKALDLVNEIAHTARSSRSSLGLTRQRVNMFVYCTKQDLCKIISDNIEPICTLSLAANVILIKKIGDGQKTCLSAVTNQYVTIYLETKGLDLSNELTKLGKQLLTFGKLANALRTKMSGSAYAAKTIEKIKKEHQEKLDGYEVKLSNINDAIERLHTLMPHEDVIEYWTKKVAEAESECSKFQEQADKIRESLPPTKKKLPKNLVKIENKLATANLSFETMKKILSSVTNKEHNKDDGSDDSETPQHLLFLLDIKNLNTQLSACSFIEGWRESQADVFIWSSINIQYKDTEQYPHFRRWYNHVASFSADEREEWPGKKMKPYIEASS